MMKMNRSHEIQINAVAFRSDEGAWIVQGIEHDISTFAHDVLDIPTAFERTIMEYVCITTSLGRKPLEGIKAAPERFKAMFDAAENKVMRVNPKIPGADIRVLVA